MKMLLNCILGITLMQLLCPVILSMVGTPGIISVALVLFGLFLYAANLAEMILHIFLQITAIVYMAQTKTFTIKRIVFISVCAIINAGYIFLHSTYVLSKIPVV